MRRTARRATAACSSRRQVARCAICFWIAIYWCRQYRQMAQHFSRASAHAVAAAEGRPNDDRMTTPYRLPAPRGAFRHRPWSQVTDPAIHRAGARGALPSGCETPERIRHSSGDDHLKPRCVGSSLVEIYKRAVARMLNCIGSALQRTYDHKNRIKAPS